MKKENAYSFFGIALVLLFAVGFAVSTSSSLFTISNPSAPTNASEDESSFTFTFDLTYLGDDESATFSFGNSSSNFGSVSITNPGSFNGTINETKQVTGTASGFSGHAGETMSIKINASLDGTSELNDQTVITVHIDESSEFDFCNFDRNTKTGFEAGSDLDITRVRDKRLDNDDEWKWRPLDSIEITVDVENNGDNDEDYIVEIVFMDDSHKIVDIAEDSDDLEEDVSVDSGDSEIVTFNFQVDGDIDEDEYNLYVKFYQEGDEDEQCVSLGPEDNEDVEVVRIDKKTNDVIVKEVTGSNSARAGSTVTLEARVANIGSDDEDKVKVIAYSSELGIRIEKEIEDLSEGDSDTVTFMINIPKNVEEKEYKISFGTEFKYDEDDEVYDKESDENDDVDYRLTILGGVTTVAPRISAELRSDAVVDQEMTLSVLVTNNGDAGDFIISTLGADVWANVLGVNPSKITLGEGETREVLITMKPKLGGYQSFKIVVIYDGETYEQPVSINIGEQVEEEPEETEGFFGSSIFTEDTSAYLIIGITALLILIILVLIVKISRRRTSGATF